VRNPKGGLSTELTVTVEDPRRKGNFVNIPSLFDGRPVNQEEALRRVKAAGWTDPETGRAIASFSSVEAAEEAAQARSKALAADPGFKAADAAAPAMLPRLQPGQDVHALGLKPGQAFIDPEGNERRYVPPGGAR